MKFHGVIRPPRPVADDQIDFSERRIDRAASRLRIIETAVPRHADAKQIVGVM